MAGRTSRIRIGTGILNVWGRSPATIAMLAAALDEASGGRFELGLGAGSPQLAEGGRPDHARESLDRWYEAGAELPAIVLPPGRDLDELEHALEVFSPAR